jgi:HPt (histidine-containing phosphotransfer) domain-containing protein
MSEAGPAVVEVEAWLAHLVPRFLANRLKDVETLAAAVRTGDFAAIQRIGHNLKGVAGGYGFAFIAEIGERLEAAANDGSATEATACMNDLDAYVRTVKVVYQ